MSSKHYTLIEHKSIYVSLSGKVESLEGNLGLPQHSFTEIEVYISRNIENSHQFLIPGFSPKYGRILKAKQFVGVIETRGGIFIEILPKIAKLNIEDTRKIFLKMLRALKNSPFKHFKHASLRSSQMHILEIFISMFCEELSSLIKKGIKLNYIARSENSNFLKGRIKIGKHIKKNLIHKERFFVELDEFNINRLENRIIKTTLDLLYKKSHDTLNKKRLREFLFLFDEVKPLILPIRNFPEIHLDRQLKDYSLVLDWCKIFLSNQSITPLKGSTLAFALFFDMNRIFEDYVASCLRKSHPEKEIQTQVSRKYLIEGPKNEFKLKPDILIDNTVIADTKWKILEPDKPHNGISQSDIYQMYAYCKKYEVKEINLIYPLTPDFPDITKTTYTFEEGLTLKIQAFDCKRGILVEN